MQPSGRRGEGERLKTENFQPQVCACAAPINLAMRKALAKMIQFNIEKMKSRAEMGVKVNKKCRQLWTLLLLCTMCMTGIAGAGIQASAKEYSYEIVLYAGNRGRFTGTAGVSVISSSGAAEVLLEGGGNVIRVRGLSRGDQVIFETDRNVELTEGNRYYVKGIRLSGRDNNTVSSPAITLTAQNQRDMDYVVAYGIRGEMTSYYVRYEDAAGRELAPERAYYGNVGDKPVVAFLYVEGYVPQAYNLTKTLSKNEAENIFTFVYNPAATGNGGGGGTGGGQGGNPDASGAGAGVGTGTEEPDAPGGEGVGAGPTGPGRNSRGRYSGNRHPGRCGRCRRCGHPIRGSQWGSRTGGRRPGRSIGTFRPGGRRSTVSHAGTGPGGRRKGRSSGRNRKCRKTLLCRNRHGMHSRVRSDFVWDMVVEKA